MNTVLPLYLEISALSSARSTTAQVRPSSTADLPVLVVWGVEQAAPSRIMAADIRINVSVFIIK